MVTTIKNTTVDFMENLIVLQFDRPIGIRGEKRGGMYYFNYVDNYANSYWVETDFHSGVWKNNLPDDIQLKELILESVNEYWLSARQRRIPNSVYWDNL